MCQLFQGSAAHGAHRVAFPPTTGPETTCIPCLICCHVSYPIVNSRGTSPVRSAGLAPRVIQKVYCCNEDILRLLASENSAGQTLARCEVCDRATLVPHLPVEAFSSAELSEVNDRHSSALSTQFLHSIPAVVQQVFITDVDRVGQRMGCTVIHCVLLDIQLR
jgi:hypothetical protein